MRKLSKGDCLFMERFLLYSQEDEDWILFNALKGIEKGFYVDVGASDPWNLSVTKFFYERGWSGINIEPLEEKYNLLCKDRKRDINLNIGVGNPGKGEQQNLTFYISGTGTTCDPNTINDPRWYAYKEKNSMLQRVLPVLRLSDVLEERLNRGQEVHFCKIDVEGFERNVLEGINFEIHRPWVMVLEAAIPGTQIPCHEKWEDILLANGYELAYISGINRYYIDSKDALRYEILKTNFDRFNLNDPEVHLFKVAEKIKSKNRKESSFKKKLRKCILWIWSRLP